MENLPAEIVGSTLRGLKKEADLSIIYVVRRPAAPATPLRLGSGAPPPVGVRRQRDFCEKRERVVIFEGCRRTRAEAKPREQNDSSETGVI